MKKKLALVLVALASVAGAHLSTAPATAAPAGCVKYCCPDNPTVCVTCCPGKPCPRLACP